MMLKRSIIIALFLVSTTAFGQMRDYIVKTNGDTVRGELRFENKNNQRNTFSIIPGIIYTLHPG